MMAVAPLAGARIETAQRNYEKGLRKVAPLAGARIETGVAALMPALSQRRSPRGSAN